MIGKGTVEVEPFKVGDYIVGKKTKTVAKIKIINGSTFYTLRQFMGKVSIQVRQSNQDKETIQQRLNPLNKIQSLQVINY